MVPVCISALIITIAGLVFGLKFADKYMHSKDETITTIYFSARYAIPIIAICSIYVVFSVLVLSKENESGIDIIKYVTAVCGLILSSLTDIKLKLIPNAFSFAMIIMWLLETVIGSMFLDQNLLFEITSSLIGGLFGGGLLLIGRLISRNGMGMGDIKIIFATGLLLKFDKVFVLLFWGLVVSVIFGISLMIFKKVKSSFRISMAPFFLTGAVALNIVTFISQIIYKEV